jgi:uncharacterized protein YbaR (Trm112 family)
VPLDPELLTLLRCPKCRAELVLLAAGDGLRCASCRVVYPVIDDIPQLLVDEARPVDG